MSDIREEFEKICSDLMTWSARAYSNPLANSLKAIRHYDKGVDQLIALHQRALVEELEKVKDKRIPRKVGIKGWQRVWERGYNQAVDEIHLEFINQLKAKGEDNG